MKILDVSLPQGDQITLGQDVEVFATIQLGALRTDEVVVDLCHGTVADDSEKIMNRKITVMQSDGKISEGVWRFKGTIHCDETGIYGYSIRILPFHPYLFNLYSMSLVTWG